MKRTPLKRKTPLKRGSIEKNNDWKKRTAKPIPARAKKRVAQEKSYSSGRKLFIEAHPICPVTGGQSTQIHHSAKREGEWLNLQRYWIAVSHEGHEWIEANKREAEKLGLMVRIYDTYCAHVALLNYAEVSLTKPLFYEDWHGHPFKRIKPHLFS